MVESPMCRMPGSLKENLLVAVVVQYQKKYLMKVVGLTGLHGFIFYFLASVLLSVLLVLKAGRRWNKYFKSRRPLFTGGLIGGLFTYVLFWTFLYGMVHVY
ncbi:PREDICTED: ER membrane protein complex subunit 6 [Charadrius vociferus]|uniref:ER membrane protein complex subunit 6 n=1 Tax=Charadrius vociferus TaxID=50402 RepID=UPI000521693F|nr:PREDICTED: ER membrane protein complex subunit 6 [Charadrius vociferus]